MAPTLFRILLALVAFYAFLRGKRDERNVSIILVVGVIATHFAWTPVNERFAGLETHVMAVDIVVFAGFLWVALRSERFWPMWIAGLQLTTIFGHLLKAVEGDLKAVPGKGRHHTHQAQSRSVSPARAASEPAM